MERAITDLKESPHWSYSAFNTYLTCPMKYYFRYMEHAEVERTCSALPFGRAFHAVLSERALKGSDFKIEDAHDTFAVYFKGETDVSENLTYKPDETFDSCLQKGFDMLTVAFDSWQDDYAVKSVAEAFSIEVPGLSKPLIGEFDLVVTDGGDECICDWKTASSKWPNNKPDYDLQATAFCYAYRQIHRTQPLFRFDVYTKAKTPTVNSYYTCRMDHDNERLENLMQKIDTLVNDGHFYRNCSALNCAECPYHNRCLSDVTKAR